VQILETTANLPREDFELERKLPRSGGVPQYDTAVAFEANVEEYDKAYVVLPNGSRLVCPLTLYVPGDADEVPDVEDRIVRLSTGRQYIVRERNTVTGLEYLSTEPDHYRLRLSVEVA
jgi:hypothetical protein